MMEKTLVKNITNVTYNKTVKIILGEAQELPLLVSTDLSACQEWIFCEQRLIVGSYN